MTTYSDIRGYRVKYLSSDPTLSTANEGQVWYNSTEGVLKSLVQIKAWSSGGNMTRSPLSTADISGAGTQSAAFGAGGYPPTNATEEYNGYAWSAGGAINTTRYDPGGSGTLTAGLLAGGYVGAPTFTTGATEEYNGSTWTSNPTGLNTARDGLGMSGTQTASLAALGGPAVTNTEDYNGTTWTNVNAANTGRKYVAMGGNPTAALVFGGQPLTVAPLSSESWNGTSWTTVNPLNTVRIALGGEGTGNSVAVAFGGGTPADSSATEEYDGSIWATSPASLSTARRYLGSAGSETAALAFGGYTTAPSAATEEYNSSIQAISKDVWASGGTYSQTARNRASFGTQTAGTLSGGYIGANSQTRDTEEYNGTSWSAGGALLPQGNPDGGTYSGIATGTQTAGLFGGGSSQGAVDYYFNTTQEYDGSTWASPTTFPSAGRILGGMFGTQTAAVLAGGYRTGTFYTNVDKYNGSTWTAGTGIPTAIGHATTSGTQTAGLFYGGFTSPTSASASTFAYDGSTWTVGGTMNTGRWGLGGSNAGTQTASIAFAGYNGTATVTSTESYDGSVWSGTANMATANSSFRQGSGTATAALAGGGSPSACEEFTGGSSAITASTLTTS